MFPLRTTLCYALLTPLLGVSAAVAGTRNSYSSASSQPRVAAAWYAGWHAKNSTPTFQVSQINWNEYTHVTYAFAETTPDVTNLSLELSNPRILPEFVAAAKSHGVKAMVSVGGWTGSRYFSPAVADAKNRTQFVNAIVSLAKQYDLDGIDFDWEYPAKQGIGCNVISTNDTPNFLEFLQELRQDPTGAKLTLSAAVPGYPLLGPDGLPTLNVTGFAEVLDWIAIMNYDVWGPWSPTVGPNAPLDDSCAPPTLRFGSATSAVQRWTQAGMPNSQIVLAVPGYGHSFKVLQADAFVNGTDTLALYPKFNATARPAGDSWDDTSGANDECGVPTPPGGTVNFWGLIEQGYLKADGSVQDGIASTFDQCSKTPFVYNSTTEIMVSYDDPQSMAAKGKFIQNQELRGFAMWEMGSDPEATLTKAVRKGAGFSN